MGKYAKHVQRKVTPQTEKIPGQEARQAKNNAGGVSYTLDDWKRLDRFLVLGSEAGTYYQTEKALTRENAACVERCAEADFARCLEAVVQMNVSGRAPRVSPQIFALALLASRGNAATDRLALKAASDVLRIPTHLFEFAEYLKALRGRGRAVKRMLSDWYLNRDVKRLAYQATKYNQRNGWSHRDILRLARPMVTDHERSSVLGYLVGKKLVSEIPSGDAKTYLEAVELVKASESPEVVAQQIRLHNLPREVLPTKLLNDKRVWEALLVDMPMTAMVRNLGKMTNIGLIGPNSDGAKHVCEQLLNVEKLKKARIHPFQILLAMTTYAAGRGVKGELTWAPVPSVVDALDKAFELSFGNVEPTGKKLLYALDISSSMCSAILNTHLSCRDASAALALLAVRTEQNDVTTIGFSSGRGYSGAAVMVLPLSRRMRLDGAIAKISGLPFGGTDCALPFMWAMQEKLDIDGVVVITDNETYAGQIHPSQAMEKYRQYAGHNVKEVVIGMTSTGFSIARPDDLNALDVVGFDADAPSVIGDFLRA